MKILQINNVYSKGSTGKIVRDINNALLSKGIESIVIYGRGRKIVEKNIFKLCSEFYAHFNKFLSILTGLMYGNCFFSTRRAIKIIKKEKPDIVHVHCINGNFINVYKIINWLKKNKIKTILTLHAEFMHTGNCGHAISCEKWKTGCGKCPQLKEQTGSLFFDNTHKSWLKMKKAFKGFENLFVVPVSNWLKRRAELSPIMADLRFVTINNGITVDNFNHQKNSNDDNVLKKYGLPLDKKIILHVSPSFNNPIKGGKFFLELSNMFDSSYQCVVIGAKEPVSDKVVSIPFIEKQEDLAIIYKRSSVFVICSVRDNYPTVCIEANCCGTPVVGFDVGGVKETIYPEMGETVEFPNVDALYKAAIKWANTRIKNSIVEEALKKNSKERMTEQYIELYKTLLSK